MTPTTQLSPQTHEVSVTRVGNQLVCLPHETRVRKGDTIIWSGPAAGPVHKGRFDKKLFEPGHPNQRPMKAQGFAKQDIQHSNDHPGPTPHPPQGQRTWVNGESVVIGADAESGVYSYTVFIQLGDGSTIESDPFVIIDGGDDL
jgi:hypothetical protein